MSGPTVDNSMLEIASAEQGGLRMLPLGPNDALRPSLPGDQTLLTVLEHADGRKVGAFGIRAGTMSLHVELGADMLRTTAAAFARAADFIDQGKGKQ